MGYLKNGKGLISVLFMPDSIRETTKSLASCELGCDHKYINNCSPIDWLLAIHIRCKPVKSGSNIVFNSATKVIISMLSPVPLFSLAGSLGSGRQLPLASQPKGQGSPLGSKHSSGCGQGVR